MDIDLKPGEVFRYISAGDGDVSIISIVRKADGGAHGPRYTVHAEVIRSGYPDELLSTHDLEDPPFFNSEVDAVVATQGMALRLLTR